MKHLGTFQSPTWGKVNAIQENYGGPTGPIAIVLTLENGEQLAVLSVNMHKPECSEDSRDLPPNCFYMKDWSENLELAREAAESGLFKHRIDLPPAASGFIMADAWEILS